MMITVILQVLLFAGATANFRIRLYEHENFGGKEIVITSPTNLDEISFNDVVTSLKVDSGDWELYEHHKFYGRRMVVRQGAQINVDINDYYSSIRPLCKYVRDESVSKLVLYEHASQQGKSTTYYVDNPNFQDFNDIATSAVAAKGDWELYEHVDFQGKRTVLREGSQTNLAVNDFYSSARPLCSTYRQRSKCSIKRMKIVDDGNFKPVLVGTKVIASNSGASCYGPGSNELSIEYAESVEESMTLEISDTEEYNWSVTLSVEVEASAKVFGSGGSVTTGISAGGGGAYSTTVTNSKSFSEGTETIVGHTTSYATPGGAIVYGIVDEYKMDRAETPVKLYLECPNEDDYVKDSTVELKAVTYPSAAFWSLTGRFSVEACVADPFQYQCIHNVRRRFSHYFGNKTEVVAAFNKCFEGQDSDQV